MGYEEEHDDPVSSLFADVGATEIGGGIILVFAVTGVAGLVFDRGSVANDPPVDPIVVVANAANSMELGVIQEGVEADTEGTDSSTVVT